MPEKMKVKALVPWFGSSRIIAPNVGDALRGCVWVCVPFAGGMAELPYIDARTIVVSDKHRHVMNLASVVASNCNIARSLARMPFHPDTLKFAQARCLEMERGGWDFGQLDQEACESWAINYFIASWMGRNGKAGIDDEFNGGLSIRWNANGGDSAIRYRNAVKSLVAWRRVMRRCTFSTDDAFAVLARCEDTDGHGIYVDPPWPEDGDRYKHGFTEAQHAELRDALLRFEKTRVVIRYGDHPLIRELYPETNWTWRPLTSRTQVNTDKAEALILNGPTRARNRSLF